MLAPQRLPQHENMRRGALRVEPDEVAPALPGKAFPAQEVVGVPGEVIAFGGGGPHCITQQVPRTA